MVITAPGSGETDFVSRCFCPELHGEDPVAGSSHCSLVPCWAVRLGQSQLLARQLSPRGSVLRCLPEGSAVQLAGKAGCISRPGFYSASESRPQSSNTGGRSTMSSPRLIAYCTVYRVPPGVPLYTAISRDDRSTIYRSRRCMQVGL